MDRVDVIALRVYMALARDRRLKTVQNISRRTPIPVQVVEHHLFQLERLALVTQTPALRWKRNPSWGSDLTTGGSPEVT